MAKKQWTIAPVEASMLEYDECLHSYGKFISVYPWIMKTPESEGWYEQHKKNLISLVEELMQKEGTATTFNFTYDEETRCRGNYGYGFTVKREWQKYVPLSAHYDYDDYDYDSNITGSIIHKRPEYGPEKVSSILGEQPEFSKSLEEHIFEILNKSYSICSEGYSTNYDTEDIYLGILNEEIKIGLGYFGEFVRVSVSDLHRRGHSGYIELMLEGEEEKIDKYLKLFMERLGTAFIEAKKRD